MNNYELVLSKKYIEHIPGDFMLNLLKLEINLHYLNSDNLKKLLGG